MTTTIYTEQRILTHALMLICSKKVGEFSCSYLSYPMTKNTVFLYFGYEHKKLRLCAFFTTLQYSKKPIKVYKIFQFRKFKYSLKEHL